jgi:tyrosine-protein kinase Etk/Wzc
VNVLYGGLPLKLKVRAMVGTPGQEFSLQRKSINGAVADLSLRFDVAEKGKMTNVLGLTLKDPNPARGAEILNEIINQYAQHKLEGSTGDASKTLALLQAKMPVLKAQLTASEDRLNQFRAGSGTVDLTHEADLYLQQGAALKAQISTLRQKKEELLRTYKEGSDVVTTLNDQLAKLQGELNQVDSKTRALPGTEKEFVRLSREVQVNTDLYTALLNNIQQLQVAGTGEVGSVTVVDPATPSLKPLGPPPLARVSLYGFLGLVFGSVTLVTKRALRQGIKDHRLIESKLGLPVLVTIPHSKLQDEHYRDISHRKEGLHLLTLLNPDDLATESLRSLRTTLHFSMKESLNRVIMVTGPAPSVGKTFVSANLAAVLAQTGSRVLVVDGDLRKGNLHHYFGVKKRVGGLSEILSGRTDWRAVIHPVSRDNTGDTTEVSGLYLITSGILPPNPSELLLTNRFSTFLQEVSENHDYVIIDAPPLLPVTDAVIIGAKAGTVLLVAKYGQHPLDEIRTCQRRLESHGIQIQGCIFNNVQPLGLGYNDYRYAYHYKYK